MPFFDDDLWKVYQNILTDLNDNIIVIDDCFNIVEVFVFNDKDLWRDTLEIKNKKISDVFSNEVLEFVFKDYSLLVGDYYIPIDENYILTKIIKTNEKYYIVISVNSMENSVLENMDSGVAIYKVLNDGTSGDDYEIQYFNKKSLIIEGKSSREVVGKTLKQLRPEIEKTSIIDAFHKVYKYGEPFLLPAVYYEDELYHNWYENQIFKISKEQIVAVYQDVTHYMVVQNELINSNEKFEKYIDKAPYGVFIADKNGRYLEVNKKACEMTGYDEEELIGMNLIDLIPKDHVKDAIENFLEAKEKGIAEVSIPFITKQGKERIWNVKAVMIDENQTLGFTEDITLSEITKNKLIESKKRLDRTQEISHVATFEYDIKSKQFYASKEAYRIFGLDGIDRSVNFDFLKGSIIDYQNVYRALMDLILYGKSYELEYEIIPFDGTNKKTILSVGERVYGENGEVLKVVGYFQDITKRKNMEAELVNREEQFRSTLQSLGEGVITTDESGIVTMINKTASRLVACDYKSVIGKNLNSVFELYGEDIDYLQNDSLNNLFKSLKYSDKLLYVSLKSKNDKIIPISLTFTEVKNDKNDILGYVLVFRDRTEEKAREEELEYVYSHDSLTGLYTRQYLENYLETYEKKNNLDSITIIMGDVNGLKLTNDVFGHVVGDRVLIKIGNILHDSINEYGIVARWGGDEFVALLNINNSEKVDKIIEKVKTECIKQTNEEMHISISLGISTYDIGFDSSKMLKQAEDNMYRQKLLESKSARSLIIESMKNTLYEKSHETKEHAERMMVLSEKVGQRMALSQDKINQLKLLAVLHDIGKIGIDDSILLKPSMLSKDEWAIMKKHPEIGYRIARSVPELVGISEGVLSHHERWDGKGYPRGLSKLEIPLISRIIAVVDAFDAMISDRPYRKAMSLENAIEELMINSAKQFDPNIVELFLKIITESGDFK